jgi:glucosyl-3-phosphoglycerate synthase
MTGDLRRGAGGSVPGRDAFDPAMLARRKAEQGLTTSVVIPARNEGMRVGAVVTAMRQAMGPDASTGVALIDEVIVVDGGSTDDTARVAAAAGARVVTQTSAAGGGKGAALQQGVAATSGELVAFVDADVHDPDPWLAIGTLAPLLVDPELRLVKSAAQRSWQGELSDGGGRVTELTVRPLLALLWPDLAHIAQPLAGEYAADRALLESSPFERGYGVELGLLLDTRRHHGAAAIGQVDLGVRRHDHQSLEALGRMAAELLLVAADRLALEGRPLFDVAGQARDATAQGSVELPRLVRDVDGELQGILREVVHDVVRASLPPLVSGGPLPRRHGPSRRR